MSKAFAYEELDEVDRELLRLLQEDGTLSSAALGERLSMTVTPCWRRRKRLEELGLIKDYQANLDRKKLGYDVMAFAQVRFGNHSAEAPDDFEQVILKLPQVLSCHKVTGEADYVLTVLATDLESYGRFVEEVLRRQPGIASIQSSLALREIKAVSRVPVR
ncbi:Lrp/AsnC family transcriptional regulator [Pseudomonas sp. P1B16]|jgi:Transcriptional regulators|uniref:Lrp/AsnC family transcriptional regulator n=1 Tax=Pseudomonas capeferrum TaxID=1495066 RepID=A0ABY7R3L9_9PSED|nr:MULTISPECIES: Lrp/AsnC family transcriptional regulator [Pseudomonas]KEY89131.1 AsnC family transcriptional regulator [Pseudomonas capeferrum]KGI95171.1 AsnC family transcriptional regulator [Pseudomonas sp. H2]MBC3482821.1 Lrp/AsnC family transcriptional regulator [Pseudomonas sp. SWRI77]MCH7301720.1 Lrp/AsnC family transcriptional regulator [Pseudomonas capeferrum]MDD1962370.1 Lrp/AsnC family transcriptional regulator [Pseudomonas sp. 39004]